MIHDHIDSAGLYFGLGGRIAQGLALLTDDAVLNAAPGKHEVEGDNLFFIADHYTSRPVEQGRLEAHRRYLDIQYLISGSEWIGHRLLDFDALTITEPYDIDCDVEFYAPDKSVSRIIMTPGMFAIFWPHDTHMPCMQIDGPADVKKIVIKIRVE